MTFAAALTDFRAAFDRVPDALPSEPVPQTPQPINQQDEEISR